MPLLYNPYHTGPCNEEYRGYRGAFAEILERHDRREQEARWNRTEYLLGLDLGQAGDYSALSILQPVAKKLVLRHIERLPLGMAYPDQVRYVGSVYNKLDARRTLVIDRTGCGRPVYDLFVEAGLGPVGITISSGEKVIQMMKKTSRGELKPVNEFRVPKLELVTSLNVVMQKKKLRIPTGLQYSDVLSGELAAFQAKARSTGHISLEAREGEHDDLVLSLALVAWWYENRSNYLRVKARPMAGRAEGAAMG